MRVVMALSKRCERTPDGAVWVKSGRSYRYYTRLLDVFDGVQLVARVRPVESVPPDMLRLDGHGVTVAPVPYYLGPWQYAKQAPEVRRAALAAFSMGDAVILGGGETSTAIYSSLNRIEYPYAMYVRADPYAVFAPGSMKHPFRPFFRWYYPRLLRAMCAKACISTYVTQEALQRCYPCPQRSMGISEVELPPEAWADSPRLPRPDARSFTMVMVGTLAQMYKAPDVLIDATADCVRGGLDLKLVLVGDGRHRPELEERAARHGIASRVFFRGQLTSGESVRSELDKADLFVLASHQEGLPRAMAEAMARALPCIGSTVGGIPELLPEEDMVAPGDRRALAEKIREVLTNPERMALMSRRNLETAQYYREDLHRRRWVEFYDYLKNRTEEWLSTKQNV